MAIIRHSYGIANFEEHKKFGKKMFYLIDAFPNYGMYHGNRTAENLANQIKNVQFKYVRVIHKAGASAVYGSGEIR